MTKEDKIYQMLNDIKTDTEKYEVIDLSDNEKEQLFESVKSQIEPAEKRPARKPLTTFLVAALILLALLGSQTSLGQEVQARASSFLEDIRYSLSQALRNEETSPEDAALSFNQVAQIGDAEISIEEMVAFDNRIVFNVLVDLDEPIDQQHFVGFSYFSIAVNGENLAAQGMSGQGDIYDEDENIHSVIYSVQLSDEVFMDDDMTIDITFDDIHVYNPSQDPNITEALPPIEGEAQFSIETELEELTQYTEYYDIEHSVSTGEFNYQIETLYLHPMINYIEVTSNNWGDGEFQLIEIRGEDNQGRQLVFEQSSSMNNQNYQRNSFTLSEETSEITSAQLADAESLELQFYSAGWPEGGMANYEAYGEPFTIELND